MGCGPLKKPLTFSSKYLWSVVLRVALACVITVDSLNPHASEGRRRTSDRSGTVGRALESPSPSSSSPSSAVAGGERIVRYYSLLGRCSESHVRMTSSHIDSTAYDGEDPYSRFRAVSDSFGSRMRLQSVLSRTFLCFSRMGKLTVKHSGKSRSCLLREVLSHDGAFVEFESVVNSTWLVGFNAKGQRLAGDQWKAKSKLRKCYQFTKTSFHYLSPVESKNHRRRHRRFKHLRQSDLTTRAKERT